MRKLQKVVKNYLIHKLNWHWLSTFLYWGQSKVNQCSWLLKGKHNGCGLHHPHQPLQPTRWFLQVTLNSFCHNTSRREVFSHKITTHPNPSPQGKCNTFHVCFTFWLLFFLSFEHDLVKTELNLRCFITFCHDIVRFLQKETLTIFLWIAWCHKTLRFLLTGTTVLLSSATREAPVVVTRHGSTVLFLFRTLGLIYKVIHTFMQTIYLL